MNKLITVCPDHASEVSSQLVELEIKNNFVGTDEAGDLKFLLSTDGQGNKAVKQLIAWLEENDIDATIQDYDPDEVSETRAFSVPQEILGDFLTEAAELDLEGSITNVDSDENIVVEIAYSQSQKAQVLDLITWLQEETDQEEEPDEEPDDDDE